MKKIAICMAAAICIICGCKTSKQDVVVIENTQVVTNAAPLGAFSRETFVWENWQFSTNKVQKTK